MLSLKNISSAKAVRSIIKNNFFKINRIVDKNILVRSISSILIAQQNTSSRQIILNNQKCFSSISFDKRNKEESKVGDNLPQEWYITNRLFTDLFDASSTKDIHDIQEGGYVSVSKEDRDKYFPEGLAGEMSEEFEFTGRESWMVRDGAKILCRILEKFEASKSKFDVSKNSAPGFRTKVNLEGLTDRSEWSDSKMKVIYYGKEIDNTSSSSSSLPTNAGGDEKLVIVKGSGSKVENVLDNLSTMCTADSKEFPSKIVLTGNFFIYFYFNAYLILLYVIGARGVGKSAALNQMILHARKRGWLCLFIPNGWDQSQLGWFIEPLGPLASKSSTASFDNTFMSAEVLRGFWKAHKNQIKNISIKNKESLGKYDSYLEKFTESWHRAKAVAGRDSLNFREMREIIDGDDYFEEQDELDADCLDRFDFINFKCETIEDLCKMGIALRDLSGSVVVDLLDELKNLDDKKMPVLLAVDQYNSWEVPSAYHYKKESVHSRDLCVPNALKFITKIKSETEAFTLKNGICVAVTSQRHPEGRNETYENVTRSIPLLIKMPNFSR